MKLSTFWEARKKLVVMDINNLEAKVASLTHGILRDEHRVRGLHRGMKRRRLQHVLRKTRARVASYEIEIKRLKTTKLAYYEARIAALNSMTVWDRVRKSDL